MTKKIEELIQAIRTGAKSSVVKPERIGTRDLGFPTSTDLLFVERALREGLDTTKYRSFLEIVKQGFGTIEGKNVYLYPVNPITTQKDIDYFGLNRLGHRGVIVNGSNNIENLYNLGVFGNPDPSRATYLSRVGVSPVCYGNWDVTLFVDKTKLMKKRNVFIDPETIGDNQLPGEQIERVGDYYFVLGGIPREAITHVNGISVDE